MIEMGPEIADARCVSKWKDSGLPTRFIFGAGCMVEVDGKWVPEANVQISLRFKTRPLSQFQSDALPAE